jgi:hypothetical protein
LKKRRATHYPCKTQELEEGIEKSEISENLNNMTKQILIWKSIIHLCKRSSIKETKENQKKGLEYTYKAKKQIRTFKMRIKESVKST